MELTQLGWNAERDQQFAPHRAKGLIPARVAVEDKHFYRAWTADASFNAARLERMLVMAHESGARPVHIWDANEGAKETFPEIETLAQRCHFRDCTHTKEKTCAVLEALAAGTLPRERYDSFVKLQLEISYLREAEKATAWPIAFSTSRIK